MGITVNKHYSGNELFSYSIFSEPESCCKDVCSCCDEETETIQFRADYTFSADHPQTAPTELELFGVEVAFSMADVRHAATANELFDQDLPPPEKLTSLACFQSFLL